MTSEIAHFAFDFFELIIYDLLMCSHQCFKILFLYLSVILRLDRTELAHRFAWKFNSGVVCEATWLRQLKILGELWRHVSFVRLRVLKLLGIELHIAIAALRLLKLFKQGRVGTNELNVCFFPLSILNLILDDLFDTV